MYIYKQNMLKSTIIVLSALDGEEIAGMIKCALLTPYPIKNKTTKKTLPECLSKNAQGHWISSIYFLLNYCFQIGCYLL